MLEELLPVFRSLAESLADGPAGAEAAADLHALEGIAAKHAAAIEADVRGWLTARLHPSVPQG
jgi:hypothetical protein